jgi:hypothetical protein
MRHPAFALMASMLLLAGCGTREETGATNGSRASVQAPRAASGPDRLVSMPYAAGCDAEQWKRCSALLTDTKYVSGNVVGYAAQPGMFFRLSTAMIRVGTRNQVLRLLKDDRPIARCMGALLLVQSEKDGSVVMRHLERLLPDRGAVEYLSADDPTDISTVGAFVWTLLQNANHLGHSRKQRAVLSDKRLCVLALEILADEPCVALHYDAGKLVARCVATGLLKFNLTMLKKLLPRMSSPQIIKAVGRFERSDDLRSFLRECVSNPELDKNSVLSAASALTRFADKEELAFLKKHARRMDRLGKQEYGVHFVKVVEMAILHKSKMKALVALVRKGSRAGVAAKIRSTFSADHALVLDDLVWGMMLTPASEDDDLRQRLFALLVKISAAAGKYDRCWNTYATAVYSLELIVGKERGQGAVERVFSEEVCQAVEKNIKDAAKWRGAFERRRAGAGKR